ncbi:ribonuclease HII [Bacillus sp. FJAT-47783]|uniref:ribonuclease HII n=1 Tax=Bacillus sp. FJAT-47783 TaxID=2922712 RepID=UPI001FAD6855|nr:ribonuclease HII [Bacillus sp. FJAT-47783]
MNKLTAKEIALKLEHIIDPNDPFIKHCQNDERKNVQQLVKKWINAYEKEKALKEEFERMCTYENELRSNGYEYIAGIDEVGRGPLAGPVVAAAVILREDFYLLGLTDSKKLTEEKREYYYDKIIEKALDVGIGFVSAEEVDTINIYEATKLAMQKALQSLTKVAPEYLLIDAMKLPIPLPQQSIIKGDANSISIAASSVVAKVTRDRYMKKLGEKYPQYGFEQHMGYGTKQHLEAITKYGVICEHRKSFAPIKSLRLEC